MFVSKSNEVESRYLPEKVTLYEIIIFPGELENDVDGSFLYGFKLLGLCLCEGVVPYWCAVFKYSRIAS